MKGWMKIIYYAHLKDKWWNIKGSYTLEKPKDGVGFKAYSFVTKYKRF